MVDDDAQAQQDELLALVSIYDNEVFSTSQDDGGLHGGHYSALLDLPQPFQIKTTTQTGHDDGVVECLQNVEFLPPIELFFQLPRGYPSKKPPDFTLTCKWLSLQQLSDLCQKLDELWSENECMEILFTWTSFLKDEVIDYLQISSPLNLNHLVSEKTTGPSAGSVGPSAKPQDTSSLQNRSEPDIILSAPVAVRSAVVTTHKHNDGASLPTANEHHGDFVDGRHENCKTDSSTMSKTDCRAVQDVGSQSMLYPLLVEFDSAQKEKVFRKTLFSCLVCFNERLGEVCIKFVGCDHVYCRSCMKEYFQVQITDGNVQGLTCPTADCDSQAFPEQVRDLVGEETFQRYDRLLLQSSLDTMSDIMYCPRKICGAIVMIETEDNMGTCPVCRLVFCTFCKKVYHGVSPCKIEAEEIQGLREKYLNGSEREKRELETRYGRRSIQKIVEDSYTQDWLNEYSKKCPSCGTYIQKIDGCNKMTCTKCRCYFCWLCNSTVPKNNPYSHFSQPDSNCFNRLFEGVIVDEL